MSVVHLVFAVLVTNANHPQPKYHNPHQDSFASTPVEKFVPKDASLLETETLALEIIPHVRVKLSVVLLRFVMSMTVEQWVFAQQKEV